MFFTPLLPGAAQQQASASATPAGRGTQATSPEHKWRQIASAALLTGSSLLTTTLAPPTAIPLPLSADKSDVLVLQSMHPSHNLTLNADTGHGSPKTLFVDASVQANNLPFLQADRVRPVADTTHGSPLALLAPTAQSLPVGASTPQSAPLRYWFQPGDASQQAWALTHLVQVQTPFSTLLSSAPGLVRALSDTSQQAYAVLRTVAATPFYAAPQSAPSLLRALADTSQSSAKVTYGDLTPPVGEEVNDSPTQALTPQRVSLNEGTSQGSASVLLAVPASAPFAVPPFGQVGWARNVADTSQDSPPSLLSPAVPVGRAVQTAPVSQAAVLSTALYTGGSLLTTTLSAAGANQALPGIAMGASPGALAATGTANVALPGATTVSAAGVITASAVSNGNVNLAGASTTGVVGILRPDVTAPLLGVAAASTAGVARADVTAVLTGTGAAAAPGALRVDTTAGLTGAPTVSTAGALRADTATGLAGAASTAAAGVPTLPGTALLGGAAGTGSAGTITATGAGSGAANVGLVGASVGASASAPLVDVTTVLTGAASAAAPGALNPAVTAVLTGAVATASPGVVAAAGDANYALAGVGSVGVAGALSAVGTANVGLVGVGATGATGSITATGDAGAGLVGAGAGTTPGVLAASGGSAYPLLGAAAVSAAGTLAAHGGGAVWPSPAQVLLGVAYGPTGVEYVGTYTDPIRIELSTGNLIKPIGTKLALML